MNQTKFSTQLLYWNAMNTMNLNVYSDIEG